MVAAADTRTAQAAPVTERDLRLIEAVQRGFPLVTRPYAAIGQRIGMSEAEVVRRLAALAHDGIIKRMGVVVRHHELGYRANAMVVWDMPDERVSELGACMGRFDFVTLCYRRVRRPPHWPYNLFCMIHGRDRDAVLENVAVLTEQCGLADIAHEVLFSGRRFKQRGALYRLPGVACAAPEAVPADGSEAGWNAAGWTGAGRNEAGRA